MAKGATVTVTGAREVRRALRDLEGEVAQEAKGQLKGAYRSAARVIEVAAKGEAPQRSGRLAKSIRSQATTTGSRVVAGGARIPYAAPIHWGWPSRPQPRRGVRGGPIAPNKFLMRARDANEDVVVQLLADELGLVINRLGL